MRGPSRSSPSLSSYRLCGLAAWRETLTAQPQEVAAIAGPVVVAIARRGSSRRCCPSCRRASRGSSPVRTRISGLRPVGTFEPRPAPFSRPGRKGPPCTVALPRAQRMGKRSHAKPQSRKGGRVLLIILRWSVDYNSRDFVLGHLQPSLCFPFATLRLCDFA
jgi:hypothetical protein